MSGKVMGKAHDAGSGVSDAGQGAMGRVVAPRRQGRADKAELASVGHEVADHLEDPVSDAVDKVKTTAEERASDVAASAKDAAHDTADQAKASAGEVNDAVQQSS